MANLTDQFSNAVVYGDFEKVKTMLAEHLELINSQDEYGFSALHNVMSEDQFEILDYILEHGANPNIQNKAGIAPLHLACYPENAALLLKHGAEINLADNNGATPLHIHAQEGRKAEEVIHYLVQQGADKSILDNRGNTAFYYAERREDSRNMQLLKI